MTTVSALCFTISYFIRPYVGSSATSLIAAFATGVASNLYASVTYNPAIICAISGIILLVPGSVATTAFFTFLQQDTSGGIGLAVGMLTLALALGVGLFLASLLVAPNEAKSWFARWDKVRAGSVAFEGTSPMNQKSELAF